MPAPKTLRERLDQHLESTPGEQAVERLIRHELKSRGHDPAEHLEPIRQKIRENFVFSGDGKQCWGRYQGITVEGHEAVRQMVNVLAVLIEQAEQSVSDQELTPLEAVQAKLKARGIYNYG
jgi:hypothetical protein